MAQTELQGSMRMLKLDFSTLKLPSQFMLTGGIVMLLAMVLAGQLVSALVMRATIENSASSSALLIDNFLAPLVQNLDVEDRLTPEARQELDLLLSSEAMQERFPHLEIWKPGGLVAYSRTPDLIGRRFHSPKGLVTALRGDVAAQYTDLEAGEHVLRDFTYSFLEVYVPLRARGSESVIAVAEIHEITEPLEDRLWQLRLYSWLAVAGASILIMLSLTGIVYRASNVIERQQIALQARMMEIEDVSRQNVRLRLRARKASERVSELTEAHLRRIGAELHDGPSQLVGFAALLLEPVRRARTKSKREEELARIGAALGDALRDIRSISKGLMLPELHNLSLRELVDRVVHVHEKRTGTSVLVECDIAPGNLPHAVKLCVYRFVQEGLNNAYRHACGAGQAVSCSYQDRLLRVVVSDRGSCRANPARAPEDGGMGLIGLRERVESLGGWFRFGQQEAGGTTVEMSLSLEDFDGEEG